VSRHVVVPRRESEEVRVRAVVPADLLEQPVDAVDHVDAFRHEVAFAVDPGVPGVGDQHRLRVGGLDRLVELQQRSVDAVLLEPRPGLPERVGQVFPGRRLLSASGAERGAAGVAVTAIRAGVVHVEEDAVDLPVGDQFDDPVTHQFTVGGVVEAEVVQRVALSGALEVLRMRGAESGRLALRPVVADVAQAVTMAEVDHVAGAVEVLHAADRVTEGAAPPEPIPGAA